MFTVTYNGRKTGIFNIDKGIYQYEFENEQEAREVFANSTKITVHFADRGNRFEEMDITEDTRRHLSIIQNPITPL